jgi:CheY-like chemotaxis protein
LGATRSIHRMSGRQTYIIATTAHAMKDDREECIEVSMNGYVSKPMRIEELQAVIKRSRSIGSNKMRKADCS